MLNSVLKILVLCHILNCFNNVTLGVQQGKPLSPLLFILFINDVNDCIDNNNLTENDLRLLSIYMLLFADDIALFTTNPNSLQLQLNALYDYSDM